MLALALLAGSLCVVDVAGPRGPAPTLDSLDSVSSLAPPAVVDDDTVPKRKRAVAIEYSEWYGRRLTVHRWASFLTLPLFAGNYITGRQLLDNGNTAPTWAIDAHGPLATGVTALFAVNTLTGGWNLLAARKDPAGRGWRTTHALLMLAADGGFAVTGLLANEAERSDQRRRLHRTVAISSIGVATLSYLMMLPPLRRE